MPERAHGAVPDTERLTLRHLESSDAGFMLALLNDPSFLHNIGDRGVRTVDEARAYITTGPVSKYRHGGFGMYRIGVRANDQPAGICTLLQRETLEHPDLGFALLPEFRSRGFAYESSAAMIAYARDVLSLVRLVAIAAPGNEASARLLRKLGFAAEHTVRLSEDGEVMALFARAL